jgi:hypothetical protein
MTNRAYTYCDTCDIVWYTLRPEWNGSHEAWLERHEQCSWFQRGKDN